MFYSPELRLIEETLKKCRLKTNILTEKEIINSNSDVFLKLFSANEFFKTLSQQLSNLEETTIYRFKDRFLCSYIFFRLPNTAEKQIFLIGPYLSNALSQNEIFKKAEEIGLSPQNFSELEHYYKSLAVIPPESHIFALLDSFAEIIWHDTYSVTELQPEDFASQEYLEKLELSEENTAWNIKIMEERYNYENEMMRAVENGQAHKVDMFLSGFSFEDFEQRLSDPIRNLKNYCIIMNTLLRKSAQRGGVHPIHLDKISSDYAAKIELLSSISAVKNLMGDMFRSYCFLVRKNSLKDYSPTIQKIVTHIELDLSANLSLSSLAKSHNINASYLSSLFKKETGKNITEYVNERRMETAKRLLKTTSLQVQTVAQYCGILDIRYFSKLFKKYCGKSPSEYRERR